MRRKLFKRAKPSALLAFLFRQSFRLTAFNCPRVPLNQLILCTIRKMAEGVGFEPTDELPHLLISSQVPLTTQPPFRPKSGRDYARLLRSGKLNRKLNRPQIQSPNRRASAGVPLPSISVQPGNPAGVWASEGSCRKSLKTGAKAGKSPRRGENPIYATHLQISWADPDYITPKVP